MRIGFLLPGTMALRGPGNGVRVQAEHQAAALERLGHEVLRLNPWEPAVEPGLDVLQFFQGGFPHFWIERARPRPARCVVFAPMIDSNQSNRRYRLAARLGGWGNKLYTIPGVFRDQAGASDVVVARSRHEQNRVVRGLGVAENKVEVVLNGVDPPQAADGRLAKQQHGLPDEYLLHVSSYLQGRKNVRRLIQAVGPLNLPLIIAGTASAGPQLEKLRQLAGQFKHVRLLGFQSSAMLASLYAGARVFCLPSMHEGTGLVALEAASFGTGVVITRRGGPPDYFGELAYYVDPSDVGSIRQAVRSAWQAPQGDRLRDHVLSKLTWNRTIRSLVDVYERRLSSRSA